MIIIKNHQNNTPLYNIRVDCPFCGDYSYSEPVYGKLQLIWSDGVNPLDIEIKEDLHIYKTKKAIQ